MIQKLWAAVVSKPMQIGGYSFEHVCNIQPDTNPDGSIRQYLPQARYANERRLSLNHYGQGPFCKFNVPKSFRCKGVYAIVVDEDVMYLGECENLSQRFNMGYGNISPRNCFIGGQETNCRLNNLLFAAASQGSTISLWFLKTESHKGVEAELRALKRPSWNRA